MRALLSLAFIAMSFITSQLAHGGCLKDTPCPGLRQWFLGIALDLLLAGQGGFKVAVSGRLGAQGALMTVADSATCDWKARTMLPMGVTLCGSSPSLSVAIASRSPPAHTLRNTRPRYDRSCYHRASKWLRPMARKPRPLYFGVLASLLTLAACSRDDRPDPALDLGVDVATIADVGVDRGPQPTLELRVDGRFEDWGAVDPLATDPAGDAIGAFDVTRLYAASRGTEVFVRFDIGERELNLAAGEATDGDLQIVLDLPGQRTLRLEMRARKATLTGKGSSTVADWLDLRYRAAPTHAAREFELGLDLATVGIAEGASLTIRVAGSDEVGPVRLDLTPPALSIPRRSMARPPGALFRLASQNTLFDGLLTADRGPSFGRLFRAARADIYCLQELWLSSATEVTSELEQIDPFGDGKPWQVHRGSTYGDTMIASRWPLTPFQTSDSAFTVAGIDLPDGGKLVVASLRLKCCGYAGSQEDRRRIKQAKALASWIADLRAKRLGSAASPFANAGVVIAGDWNLVGSRTPLTLLENDGGSPAGPGLKQLWLPKIVGNDVWTWSDYGSSYAPGRLDIVLFDASPYEVLSGFVFDSRQLETSELTPLGLQAHDSRASDHLLVVADFARKLSP